MRVERYATNSALIKGNVELLQKINSALEDRPYVSANFAGLICKKAADLLFGEEPMYSAGEEGSPEQAAIDRIVKNSSLNLKNYETAHGNAFRGDAFYKIKWAQKFRGSLPESIDPYRVVIETQNASYVFPETLPGNSKEIVAYHIAIPVSSIVDGRQAWELFVESHYPGYITEASYGMRPTSVIDGRVTSWVITAVLKKPENQIETGVPIPLVVHVPNYALDDSWEGIDDITEHRGILAEINHRLTQIASILDKHADPILTVPTGVLEEGPDGAPVQKAAYAKVFEVLGKDDIIPQYVTWDGQLESAFKALDKLVDILLTTSELPPVALGKENAGTSGASGLSVKYRMGPLLSKIGRKRQYFDAALKEVLLIAQLLEQAQTTTSIDYTPTIPHIVFNDGLPTDEREQAEIAQIRTGGKPTLSVRDAVKRLDGLTDAQADQAIGRIEDDETRVNGTVDASIFNETGGAA
ncbi:phage portal protein [Paenibacillus shunpengii]|uniref:Phage portal protein n=1 Tax=Paenibacillus shunpengii TaxID=2054424 RepID=A0ABW5STW6_9BACL